MLTVALLQLDRTSNLDDGTQACRTAAAIGADIALFPEMWNVGYRSNQPEFLGHFRSPELWNDETAPDLATMWTGAIALGDPFIGHFQALAREVDMAIAVTFLQHGPRNSLALIDRHGEITLTYAKVHTYAHTSDEAALIPGDEYEVCTLDTRNGPVRVGGLICFDRAFPEAARVLMLQGAELILIPNACEMNANRLSQVRTRAYENMVAVAMANYAGPGWGHSAAFDGMAGSAETRDMLMVEAGEHPGVFPATFDLDALREYRRREVWGDAFRRPSTYSALTDPQVRAPFVRADRDGRTPPG